MRKKQMLGPLEPPPLLRKALNVNWKSYITNEKLRRFTPNLWKIYKN